MKVLTILLLSLVIIINGALALRCYVCEGASCTESAECPADSDRCMIQGVDDYVIKHCGISAVCEAMSYKTGLKSHFCCSSNYCNGSTGAKSSLLLIGLSASLAYIFSSMF